MGEVRLPPTPPAVSGPWQKYQNTADPWAGFQPAPEPADTSFSSALRQGVAAPLQAIGETVTALGAPETGAAIAGAVEAPKNYQSASAAFMQPNDDGGALDYSWSYLPRAIVEQAGNLAGSVALRGAGAVAGGALAGAASGGTAAPLGAAAGAFAAPALFQALQTLGPVANARARADGREEPNEADWTAAAAAAGLSGVLEAFGVGTVARFGKGLAITAAREGASQAAQSALQQAAETAGTKQGLTVDARQAIGEGIIGAGTAAAIHAPVRGAEAARDQLQGRPEVQRQARDNPEQFASELRAQDAYGRRREAEADYGSGKPSPPPEQTFDSLRQNYRGALGKLADTLYAAGDIDKDGRAIIRQAISAAAAQDRDLARSPVDSIIQAATGWTGEQKRHGMPTEIDAVAALDLHPETRKTLLDGLRDLNTVAGASRRRQGAGPLEAVTRAASPVITSGIGYSLGGPLGAVGGFLFRGAVEKSAAGTARAVDGALGSRQPEILRRAKARAAVAEALAVDPGNTEAALMAETSRAQDWRSTILRGEEMARDTERSQREAQASRKANARAMDQVQGIANRENAFRDTRARQAAQAEAGQDRQMGAVMRQAETENRQRDAWSFAAEESARRQEAAQQKAAHVAALRENTERDRQARAEARAAERQERQARASVPAGSSGPLQFTPEQAEAFRARAQEVRMSQDIRRRSTRAAAQDTATEAQPQGRSATPQRPPAPQPWGAPREAGGRLSESQAAPVDPLVALANLTPAGWKAGIVRFVRESHGVTDASIREVHDAIRDLPVSEEVREALLSSKRERIPEIVLYAVTNRLLERRGVDLEGTRGAASYAQGVT